MEMPSPYNDDDDGNGNDGGDNQNYLCDIMEMPIYNNMMMMITTVMIRAA